MLDAAALAAILDPERKVPGWWKKDQPNFGPPQPLDTLPWTFAGPPNLHTAREHNWRLEEWLEARGYGWSREDYGYGVRTCVCKHSEDMSISVDVNHTAALVAAIERIVNG